MFPYLQSCQIKKDGGSSREKNREFAVQHCIYREVLRAGELGSNLSEPNHYFHID